MMTDKELYAAVKKVVLNNLSEGYSPLVNHNYCYVKPAPNDYPFQFFWDTCFNVYILCDLEEYEIAKNSMRSLFATQKEDGFVGHMIYWKKKLPLTILNILQAKPTLENLRPQMSEIIQPPLAAQAVLRIYKSTQDLAFVQEMLPKLEKYHLWLRENRDFDSDGLLTIISSFESGMDWKPSFDPVIGYKGGLANETLFWKNISVEFRNFIYRYDLETISQKNYFIVKEVAVNTIYVLDLYAMAELSKVIKNKESERQYTKLAQKVVESIKKVMYDKKRQAFFDVYGKENKKSSIMTATSFFPLVFVDQIDEKISTEMIEQHLLNPEEFNSPYPVPSVSLSEPSFFPYETKFLWRGPTWVFINWFIMRCLLVRGYSEMADKLIETVKNLINQSGFREYYNPLSGVGYGATDFTWSGLVLDMMRIREEYK